jgi:hypothetical protein
MEWSQTRPRAKEAARKGKTKNYRHIKGAASQMSSLYHQRATGVPHAAGDSHPQIPPKH